MSQNNQCACDPSNLVMLPVRGFGLAVDPSGLVPAPVPTPGACRERVDQDMHIYINGNLQTSGDGLSPETAVKSFEDAVLALSRYDGCNQYSATFHFADLEDQEAVYPDVTIYGQSHATFRFLTLTGESHQTTKLGKINVLTAAYAALTDLCASYVLSKGWLNIYGKAALRPYLSEKAAFCANWGGNIRFGAGSEMFLYPGQYLGVIYSMCGIVLAVGPMKFHALGVIDVETSVVRARGNAAVWFNQGVDFSDCAAVTGRQYMLSEQSCLYSNGATLPGSLPGVTLNNGLYL